MAHHSGYFFYTHLFKIPLYVTYFKCVRETLGDQLLFIKLLLLSEIVVGLSATPPGRNFLI